MESFLCVFLFIITINFSFASMNDDLSEFFLEVDGETRRVNTIFLAEKLEDTAFMDYLGKSSEKDAQLLLEAIKGIRGQKELLAEIETITSNIAETTVENPIQFAEEALLEIDAILNPKKSRAKKTKKTTTDNVSRKKNIAKVKKEFEIPEGGFDSSSLEYYFVIHDDGEKKEKVIDLRLLKTHRMDIALLHRVFTELPDDIKARKIFVALRTKLLVSIVFKKNEDSIVSPNREIMLKEVIDPGKFIDMFINGLNSDKNISFKKFIIAQLISERDYGSGIVNWKSNAKLNIALYQAWGKLSYQNKLDVLDNSEWYKKHFWVEMSRILRLIESDDVEEQGHAQEALKVFRSSLERHKNERDDLVNEKLAAIRIREEMLARLKLKIAKGEENEDEERKVKLENSILQLQKRLNEIMLKPLYAWWHLRHNFSYDLFAFLPKDLGFRELGSLDEYERLALDLLVELYPDFSYDKSEIVKLVVERLEKTADASKTIKILDFFDNYKIKFEAVDSREGDVFINLLRKSSDYAVQIKVFRIIMYSGIADLPVHVLFELSTFLTNYKKHLPNNEFLNSDNPAYCLENGCSAFDFDRSNIADQFLQDVQRRINTLYGNAKRGVHLTPSLNNIAELKKFIIEIEKDPEEVMRLLSDKILTDLDTNNSLSFLEVEQVVIIIHTLQIIDAIGYKWEDDSGLLTFFRFISEGYYLLPSTLKNRQNIDEAKVSQEMVKKELGLGSDQSPVKFIEEKLPKNIDTKHCANLMR